MERSQFRAAKLFCLLFKFAFAREGRRSSNTSIRNGANGTKNCVLRVSRCFLRRCSLSNAVCKVSLNSVSGDNEAARDFMPTVVSRARSRELHSGEYRKTRASKEPRAQGTSVKTREKKRERERDDAAHKLRAMSELLRGNCN